MRTAMAGTSLEAYRDISVKTLSMRESEVMALFTRPAVRLSRR